MSSVEQLLEFDNSCEGIKNLSIYRSYCKRDDFYKKYYPKLEEEIVERINFLTKKEDKKSGESFFINCVKFEKGYRHFGIHECTASLYGDRKEDIVTLKLIKAENQDRGKDDDYWGFFNIQRGKFTLVYQCLTMLSICFPNSINSYEKDRSGLFVKLDILNS